jgi:hypothetical protein
MTASPCIPLILCSTVPIRKSNKYAVRSSEPEAMYRIQGLKEMLAAMDPFLCPLKVRTQRQLRASHSLIVLS